MKKIYGNLTFKSLDASSRIITEGDYSFSWILEKPEELAQSIADWRGRMKQNIQAKTQTQVSAVIITSMFFQEWCD